MSRIQVTVDVLSCTKMEKAARAFAEFTVSKDAQDIFAKQGFSPAPAGNRKIYDKAAGVGIPAAAPAIGAPAAAPAAGAANIAQRPARPVPHRMTSLERGPRGSAAEPAAVHTVTRSRTRSCNSVRL